MKKDIKEYMINDEIDWNKLVGKTVVALINDTNIKEFTIADVYQRANNTWLIKDKNTNSWYKSTNIYIYFVKEEDETNDFVKQLEKLRASLKEEIPPYNPAKPWNIPPKTIPMPEPKIPWSKPINVCNICGLDCSGTMGYVCRNKNCPIFPNTYCNNS